MIGKNSVRVQAIMTKQEGDRLEEIAKKEGRSISNLVAKVIRDFLSKKR